MRDALPPDRTHDLGRPAHQRCVGYAPHAAFRSRLATADNPSRPRAVTYTNTRGETFTSGVDDILHHVAMHAMYHRGQIMRGVRTGGGEPKPTDFIVFTRGSCADREVAISADEDGVEHVRACRLSR